MDTNLESSARGSVPDCQLKACSGIFVSGYNSKTGVAGCGSGSLDVTLKLVDDHHFPACQIQGEKMEKTQLQDCSIFWNKF